MHPAPLVAALPLLAATALLLTACGANSRAPADPHTIVKTPESGPATGRPTLGMPIVLSSGNTALIPFALESEKGWTESGDAFASRRVSDSVGSLSSTDSAPASENVAGGFSPFYHTPIRWHNAIIRDLSTNNEWPLLSTRGVISQWQLIAFHRDVPGINNLHFYAFLVTLADTNKNGILDSDDANVLLLTDGEGRGPRFVTPANAKVVEIQPDVTSRRVFLKLITDTNADSRLDFNDEPSIYIFNPRAGPDALAEPAVSPAMKARVESLLK